MIGKHAIAGTCRDEPADAAMKITPAQVRAGRALIDWSTTRLASRANTSSYTLRLFERGKVDLSAPQIDAIRQALEAAGVEFTDGEKPGVRLRMPT
jgi:transcriptional regulator with XRE-family HTH domain